jgi:hypothetical protein
MCDEAASTRPNGRVPCFRGSLAGTVHDRRHRESVRSAKIMPPSICPKRFVLRRRSGALPCARVVAARQLARAFGNSLGAWERTVAGQRII